MLVTYYSLFSKSIIVMLVAYHHIFNELLVAYQIPMYVNYQQKFAGLTNSYMNI